MYYEIEDEPQEFLGKIVYKNKGKDNQSYTDTYDYKGILRSSTKITKDKNDNIVREDHFEMDKLVSQTFYKYDKNLLVEKFLLNGVKEKITNYQYDNMNNIIAEESKYLDTIKLIKSKYNKNNDLIERQFLRNGVQIQNIIVKNRYNQHNTLVQTSDYVNEKIYKDIKYKYDKIGNWIGKEIKNYHYTYNQNVDISIYLERRIIEYY